MWYIMPCSSMLRMDPVLEVPFERGGTMQQPSPSTGICAREGGPQSARPFSPPPLRAALVAMLASVALCLAATPNASAALTIGIMSGGNDWQDESQWDAMKHSGAATYRMMVSLGTYTSDGGWTKLDKAFRLAAEREITILPYLFQRANFSQQFPTETEWKKTEAGSWTWWVYAVVHRYGYSGEFWQQNPNLPYRPVTAWEVWNEPNLKKNNPGGATVQPGLYAKFLKYTGNAIQLAQQQQSGSGTQVLFAGLISYGEMSVGSFLQQAKAAVPDLGSYFHGLSLHPYSFTNGLGGVQTNVNDARQKLNESFSSSKGLWITELGWNVEDYGDANHPKVSETAQRDNLTASFNWLKSVAVEKNLQSIIWYFYRDCVARGCAEPYKWDYVMGLRRADGVFRLAWYAFQEQTGAPAWPIYQWQPTDNLGKPANGPITSDPDISSWGYGRLDVFAKGPNNELVHKAYENGWHPWENLGGVLASGPAAVSWSQYRIDIVALATDGTINHWAYNGANWEGPDNLGHPANGPLTSSPDISSHGTAVLDIFARGAGGELEHKYFWGGWSGWENLGYSIQGGPGAVSWDLHRIDVVARASNNTLNHWAWNEVSWPFDNLAGSLTSDPDISSWGYGRLDIFARGPGNELLHKWYPEGWGGWENLGGTLTSGPGAVSWSNKRIDVVARATDDTVTHWSYDLILPP
jgi:Repeat of unknown function (DUF346)